MSYPNPYQAASEGFSDDTPEALKHSGLGIASLVTGLAAGLLEIAVIVIAGVVLVSMRGGADETARVFILIGFAAIAGMALGLVGIGLGIAGLFQRRKKLFAVLGIIAGSLVVLEVVSLMVLGMMAGN